MRKTFTLLFIALCAVGMQAQSYGILVNGKIYFAGSYTDEFEGFTQYLAHSLKDSPNIWLTYKSSQVITANCMTQKTKLRGQWM